MFITLLLLYNNAFNADRHLNKHTYFLMLFLTHGFVSFQQTLNKLNPRVIEKSKSKVQHASHR